MNNYLMNVVDSYDIKIEKFYENFVVDDSGKRYLDFWGDEGVNSIPYGIVSKAAMDHFRQLKMVHIPKMFNDGGKCIIKLAQELVENCKIEKGKVFFNNSGTEANETAIKLARLYWYKKKQPYRFNIAVLENNFHGRTGFSLAASDSSDSPYHKLGFGPMPVGFYHFKTIDELYKLSKIPGGLAAVMMAPVLGNNCVKLYDKSFFNELEKFRAQTGTLIIFDEVQVGMGRTGKFMAYQNYGITPDIVTLGKGLASGMPLSATISKGFVAESMTPGSHFNTMGGNNLACSISLKVVEYVNDNLDNILEIGDYIRHSLSVLPFVDYVVGLGIHNAFKLNFRLAGVSGIEFAKLVSNKGLLLCSHREFGEIRFSPPLCVNRWAIDAAINIMVGVYYDIKNRK